MEEAISQIAKQPIVFELEFEQQNPNYKRIEFDTFKKDAGTNSYVLATMV